jgi:hypothetical protein
MREQKVRKSFEISKKDIDIFKLILLDFYHIAFKQGVYTRKC